MCVKLNLSPASRAPAAPALALLILLGLHLSGSPAIGAALQRAEVTAVINQVKLLDPKRGDRDANVQDVVQGDLGLKTGVKSRAELLFQDRTLTRLGANTIFSFTEGTRELELEQGTLLLQVPKGRGGAKVRTAAVTAAITGTTVLLEYSPPPWMKTARGNRPPLASLAVADMMPDEACAELEKPSRKYSRTEIRELKRKCKVARTQGGHVKVMVLEGTLRLYLNNRLGESVLVQAGEMIILSPNASVIPPPVSFNIARVVETSLLVNEKYWGPRSADVRLAEVQSEIAKQEKLFQKGSLAATNLKILGGGTNVVVDSTLLFAQLNQAQTAKQASNDAPPSNLADLANNDQLPGGETDGSSGGTPPPPPPPGGEDPELPPVDPGEQPGDPELATELPGFRTEGSTTVFSIGAPVMTSPTVPANASVVSILTDVNDPDDIPVLPTEGSDFALFSTASTAEAPGLTATKLTRTFSLAPAPAGVHRAFTFDYRFLSNEIDQPNFPDQFNIIISQGSESFVLALDRNTLSPGGTGILTPVGQAGVGGFEGGTDWLPFTIDVTRFTGGEIEVSFLIWDVGDTIVDSAFAVDRIGVINYPSAPEAGLPGKLTLNLDSVTFGNGAGQFKLPNLNGLDARNNAGEAASVGEFVVNAPGPITLNAPLSATTGKNGTGTPFGGTGGRVTLNSANAGNTEGDTITINSTIKVSESSTAARRASAAGGTIRLNSAKTSGVAINVANTGELLALLNAAAPGPGGRIELKATQGGNIQVSGKIRADRGDIDIQTLGDSGRIILSGAELAANVVKAGAMGANGQLIIGGGSISADTAIKLYANGSNGTVLFNDNVALNGNSVKTIAGNTVTIANGKTVTVNGPSAANVFANHANYTGSGGNNATSGQFGGKGATTQPFANRPAF